MQPLKSGNLEQPVPRKILFYEKVENGDIAYSENVTEPNLGYRAAIQKLLAQDFI